jgi:hypothetical protein
MASGLSRSRVSDGNGVTVWNHATDPSNHTVEWGQMFRQQHSWGQNGAVDTARDLRYMDKRTPRTTDDGAPRKGPQTTFATDYEKQSKRLQRFSETGYIKTARKSVERPHDFTARSTESERARANPVWGAVEPRSDHQKRNFHEGKRRHCFHESGSVLTGRASPSRLRHAARGADSARTAKAENDNAGGGGNNQQATARGSARGAAREAAAGESGRGGGGGALRSYRSDGSGGGGGDSARSVSARSSARSYVSTARYEEERAVLTEQRGSIEAKLAELEALLQAEAGGAGGA